MSDIEAIRAVAIIFRDAIERCIERLNAVSLRQFPRGSCGDVSDMLGMFMQETLKVDSEYVSGWANRQSHAWLELDRIVIDITADQFEGNEAVIVSGDSQFHRQFDIEIRRSPDIDGATMPHLSDLEHDYTLIVATARKLAADPDQ